MSGENPRQNVCSASGRFSLRFITDWRKTTEPGMHIHTPFVLLPDFHNTQRLNFRNNADLGKGVLRRHVFHDAWELLFFFPSHVDPIRLPQRCLPRFRIFIKY